MQLRKGELNLTRIIRESSWRKLYDDHAKPQDAKMISRFVFAILTILTSFAAVVFVLCYRNSDVYAASSNRSQIESFIVSLDKLNVANESTTPDGDVLVPNHSVGYLGTGSLRKEVFEQKLRLTRTLEKWVAFNPHADSLYPGGLVQGSSLPDGVLNPLAIKRTPVTVTITDLIGSSPGTIYSEEVKSPTLASIQAATSKILSQNLAEAQPAKISFSQIAMSSIEEGFLKLGASYKWMSGRVSGSFQRSDLNRSTSIMVRIVQSYYTVSVNAPSSPASFIDESVNLTDFKRYAGLGNPPAYIASVTYGRELWLLVESNATSDEVKSAFNAAFSAGVAGGALSLDAQQKSIIDQSSIQVMLLGGGGAPAVQLLVGDQLSKLKSYLLDGANYSKSSPGVIISYTVRYLKDNDAARVSSATDYNIKTQQNKPEMVPLTSITANWTTTGDDKDWNTSPKVEIFNKDGVSIASIGCCSSDRDGDEWDTGRSETRNLTITKPSDAGSLEHGRFSAGATSVGTDHWRYNVVLTFNFSDGSQKTYSCSGEMFCSINW